MFLALKEFQTLCVDKIVLVATNNTTVVTYINKEGHPSTQVSTSSLAMVARGKQCPHRPTTTPHKACSTDIYRRIKRRVGRSLKRVYCKRILVGTGKRTAHKLTQSGVFGPQRVPKSLCRQNSSSSNRQYYSGRLHKQRRGHEVRPSMCPTVENLDLVFPATSDTKSPTHPRPLKCDSRQAIQAGSNHPDRVVPTSRSFSSDMQPMALASDRPICHEVQPQVASVCLPSTGLPGCSSGCTYAYAFPTTAILGRVVEKLLDSPCKRIILIAPGWPNMPWFWDLVTMSSQVPLSLPNRPDLLTQPFNQIPHRNLTNLNLHAWLLEPQQSNNMASLRQWQQELRPLKGAQPDQSMRQSGPFLQSGASLIRWTSGLHL